MNRSALIPVVLLLVPVALWLGGCGRSSERAGVWGAEVEGVQVSLVADKARWKADETPTLKAQVRNGGKRELYVWDTRSVAAIQVDGKWYAWSATPELHNSDFLPGQYFRDIPVALGPDWKIGRPGEKASPLHLAPGRHTVYVGFTAHWEMDKMYGPINALSNPVEIEVLPAQP